MRQKPARGGWGGGRIRTRSARFECPFAWPVSRRGRARTPRGCRHSSRALLTHPHLCSRAPPPRHQSPEGLARAGCQDASTTPSQIQTCCPARGQPRPSMYLLQLPRLKRGPGKRVPFRARQGGRRRRRSREAGFHLGASPGSTQRPSTSRSSPGRGRRIAKFRLEEAPLQVRIRPPLGPQPAQIPGDHARGGGAAVGQELRAGIPGRRRRWERRAGEGCGRDVAGSSARAATRAGTGGLTPPPTCPGSDGSSRRAPRAGRGRGRGRRRRRPPGRRGRRRAAGNP